MMDDMMWTPPKPLTFSARTKLTWWLLCGSLRSLAVSVVAVWRSGEVVSFNQIAVPNGSHVIASGNGWITSIKISETAV